MRPPPLFLLLNPAPRVRAGLHNQGPRRASSTSLGADLLLNAHVPPLEPTGCSRTPSHPNSSSRIRRILLVTSPEHNSAARLETWPLARIPTRSGTGDDS